MAVILMVVEVCSELYEIDRVSAQKAILFRMGLVTQVFEYHFSEKKKLFEYTRKLKLCMLKFLGSDRGRTLLYAIQFSVIIILHVHDICQRKPDITVAQFSTLLE